MGFDRKRRPGLRRRRVDLRKTLFVLPNLMTLGSVFCGLNAILIASAADAGTADFQRAAVLLVIAMICDLLDGRVARMTKTQSAFGLELDSLADIVSFGVAPAVLIYRWVLHRSPALGIFTAFLFIACAAIRLARFNVLSSSPDGPVKPGRYIIGLPTPPAAGILISLVLANHAVGGALGEERHTGLLFAVTVVVSLLMVSTVRFRSFKDLKLDLPTAALFAFVLGTSAVVWDRLEPQFVLVWLLAFYVAVGLFDSLWALTRRALRLARRDSLPPAPDPGLPGP